MPARTDHVRNREILRRWNSGEHLAPIAATYGITPSRVTEIVRSTRTMLKHAPRRNKALHLRRTKVVIEGAIALARLRPDEVGPVLSAVAATYAVDFDVVIRPDHDAIRAFMDANPLVEEVEDTDAPT